MRELADAERIRRFMSALGPSAPDEATCYLTGGATAVLIGWRATTVDVDIALDPEYDELLRVLPRLKDELHINVELASPRDFIPLPDGWAERSPFVAREGRLTFRHFDPYAQSLAKLERGHARDLDDVRAMMEREWSSRTGSGASLRRSSRRSTGFPPSTPRPSAGPSKPRPSSSMDLPFELETDVER